jgi:hypothetical protein
MEAHFGRPLTRREIAIRPVRLASEPVDALERNKGRALAGAAPLTRLCAARSALIP